MPVSLPSSLNGVVTLPPSKSLSARALVLNALSARPGRLHHLSDCDDTRAVVDALSAHPEVVDISAAGTAMRFLTAFYATRVGETHVLTGTERMQQRPIGILVDALRSLGADIECLGQEGYPPLRIVGKYLAGGELEVPAHWSSQYVSALLMIAPTLERGLQLRLKGVPTSLPYLRMTLRLMREFGAESRWETDTNTIVVPPTDYHPPTNYTIEPDWSAASYWYELLALSPDADAQLFLRHLSLDSAQGDSVCARLFAPLGVATTPVSDGIWLRRTPSAEGALHADLADCPDLAQTLVVTCAMLRRAFHFKGLHTLKIKETDRIAALTAELAKYGITLSEPVPGELAFMPTPHAADLADARVSVATYSDHRMAMAFAPTAYRCREVDIQHPEVVSKSYPSFWDDLAHFGHQ